jgi:hypothetical protein
LKREINQYRTAVHATGLLLLNLYIGAHWPLQDPGGTFLGREKFQPGARTWPNGANGSWPTRYRGPLLIHAARKQDDLKDLTRYSIAAPDDRPTGGIVGLVEIVDCVTASSSRWHIPGQFGFLLARPCRCCFTPGAAR